MRKLMLTVTSILFISLPSLFAQTSHGSEWAKIESGKVPASIQQTLKSDSRYKGWENSEVFYNKDEKQYSVDIKNGSTPHSYLFTSNGQAISTVKPLPSDTETKSLGSTIPGKDPGTPPAIDAKGSTANP